MVRKLTTIGFDADDTLWHNERFFRDAQAEFGALLADFADAAAVDAALLEAEKRNIWLYGFGVKGFTLSMMETALHLSAGRVEAPRIGRILALGRAMLAHPVELLPGVEAVLDAVGAGRDLILITKGDLFDQERKLTHSGLADRFAHVEIVSDKRPQTYARIFDRHGQGTRRAMMVGNSLKSDVIPALEAGAFGVHVPQEMTWALEHAAEPRDHPRYFPIGSIDRLPLLVETLEDGPAPD